MAIVLDPSDLALIKTDLDALVVRFGLLSWTYNTDAASEIRYQGALVSPYNVNAHQLQITIPIASDGLQSYSQATFFWIAAGQQKLALPAADTTTRASWTTMADVAAWVEACIDQMT